MVAVIQDREVAATDAVRIAARDGLPLAASVFPAQGGTALVVNSATGTPRAYYRAFAEFMAGRGTAVVTYDYRGIGGSREPGPLSGMHATMRQWAELDAAAVLDWTAERFPGRKLAVVGHSFGGQCLGLLPNAHRVQRAALIASQLGYWGHFARRDQARAWLGMHALIPGLTHVLGYFPASKVGLGEDLPKGVALEWARWCRSPNYLFDHLSPAERGAYDAFQAPLLAYKISDDSFASAQSVDKLLAFYPRANPLLRTVTPQELGVRALGHFGPFRSAHRETLWEEWHGWLAEGRAPTAAVRV